VDLGNYLIFNTPAYQSGDLPAVVTADESGLNDVRACPAANQFDCATPTGSNTSNPGFSEVLSLFGIQSQIPPTTAFVYPGGGQVGAVLFNKRHINRAASILLVITTIFRH